MPRKSREEAPGAIHHVFARGAKKDLIAFDDADRQLYVDTLASVVLRQEWLLLAWCLMPNHVHLVVETPTPNLADGMYRLHGPYARKFNKRHDMSGHVFQGRYGSKRVKSDAQLWQLVGYVDRNPVEARLCESAEAWRWGSAGAVARGVPPKWLAARRWDEFVEGIRGGQPARSERTP